MLAIVDYTKGFLLNGTSQHESCLQIVMEALSIILY